MSARARRFDRPDYWILAVVGIMCIIGVLMVFSSSGINEEDRNLITKHIFALGVGMAAMFVTMSVPYERLRRLSVPLLVFSAVLLMLVLVIAEPVNGAKRWLDFGPLSFQPSELVKFALVLYLADWCYSKGDQVRDLSNGLVPFGIVLGFLGGLVFIEPDMGTMLVIFAIGTTMYFVSGAAILHLIGGFVLAIVGFLLAAIAEPYRFARILSFLDPYNPAQELGSNYHILQSLMTLGSGGLTGQGLGASRGKYGWLFAQSTDAIFSVWAQEVGFVGALLLIGLFIVFAWRGFRVARLAPDGFTALLATGLTTWVIAQAMINIGAVSGAIPFTGVPLPFISYGGSSLVITLSGVGLLLNLSRYATSERAVPAGVGAGLRVLRTVEGRR
ncbi:MAG: putative lipid II flippase FtsW [Chloroflexia bacterium]